MKVRHLAGLDGLRFISISFVVLHHLFTFKAYFGFHNLDLPVLGLIGYYGIQFFFMGSGFLITFLLLCEIEEKGRISLKHFYLRRIFRIWPAYYLLIIIALVLLFKLPFFRIPGITDNYLHANYSKSNLFYFLFLPHLQPFFFPTAPLIHQTYTIGIEEQFYILWGFLFFLFGRRLRNLFILIVITSPILSFVHDYIHNTVPLHDQKVYGLNIIKSVITYFQYSRFSTFAIGSLFGYAYFKNDNWIFLFKKPVVQFLIYIIILSSILFEFTPAFFHNEYISLLMGCLMLIATFRKESVINYSTSWLNSLGKISYGIYLFHMIAIVLAIQCTLSFFSDMHNPGVEIFLIATTLLLSIVFGYISYYFFEKYFLKIKRHFSKLKVIQ